MAHEKILVVEDEMIVADDIKNCLLKEGYIGEIVSNGEDAIRKVNEYHPDIILMDIMLKGSIDGIETAGRIKERFSIPIIYLTAYSDKKMIERAKLTNPLGYLVKPFNKRDLCISIEMTLYKHQLDLKINENKAWLDATLRSINDAIIATDPQGRVKFMNLVAQSMTRAEFAEFEGKTIQEMFDIKMENHVKSSLEKEPTDIVLIQKNNMKVPIDIRNSNIIDDRGTVKGIVTVFRNISERKRVEMELKRINSELLKADKLKNQFLSVVSHELRTPLTPMKAHVQMMLAEYFGIITQKQKESLEMLLRNTSRLDRLIGEVLDISKLEAGVLKFNISKVDLCEITRNAVDTMRSTTTEKKFTINFNGEKIPRINADGDRITQTLMNLIDNAIKFTNNEGKIEVNVSQHQGKACVRVRDNGIGIKYEDQKRIFKPFVQVDPSFSRKYDGTGLGLSICEGIVKFHGGEIWVESEPGKGSTFYFTIPFDYEPNTAVNEIKILDAK